MDAAAELGRNPVSKHQIQPEYENENRLTRDGTAEPVSRGQILRHARGQGNINFPCSADYEQDWRPYPVDPYSAKCDDHTYNTIYRVEDCPLRRVLQQGFRRSSAQNRGLGGDVRLKSGEPAALFLLL